MACTYPIYTKTDNAGGINRNRTGNSEANMKQDLHSKAMDHLFDAILCLKNKEECYQFFEDVCTINEIQAMAQRLEVAGLLRKGETYQTISKETGASTATISRVNRFINYGSDGYQLVWDRLGDE